MIYKIVLQLMAATGIWVLTATGNPVLANSVGEALAASQRGDHDVALSVLKTLASNSNKLAQYNIGLFYKKGIGVAPNPQLAEYWFDQAARNGVVNAYEQLRADAIRPGKSTRVKLVFGPQEWIRVQNPGDYTLQLASSRNIRLIKRYYAEYQLQGRGGYFLNKKRNHYALVFGTYPSVADATAAIKDLPEELRQWQPWVRQLQQIQSRMSQE